MLQSGWGLAHTAHMEQFLKQFVLFGCDGDLCITWAEIVDSERRKGRVISTQDAWIAATAILNHIPLVSHNRRHFEGINDLTLISETASR